MAQKSQEQTTLETLLVELKVVLVNMQNMTNVFEKHEKFCREDMGDLFTRTRVLETIAARIPDLIDKQIPDLIENMKGVTESLAQHVKDYHQFNPVWLVAGVGLITAIIALLK